MPLSFIRFNAHTLKVLEAIGDERQHQDTTGNSRNDAIRSLNEIVSFINYEIKQMPPERFHFGDGGLAVEEKRQIRHRLVRIAAVAAAFIEQADIAIEEYDALLKEGTLVRIND